MPIATNPDTGETVFLSDSGAWQKAQTAVNPQTKEMMAFDGKSWSPVQAKSKGVLNYIDDAVRSIASGVTFGFSDELAAKGNELIGKGTYEKNIAEERARNEQIHPGIRIPGEIAGAMAIPLGGVLGGATRAARTLRGSGVGAGVGALSGAGEGTDAASRAEGALVGGAIGAVTGAAAVPVVEGVSRGIGLALSKPLSIGRAVVNPDAAADRAVGRAYQDATRLDPRAERRLDPAELVPGGPARVVDTLGEQGRDLARSSANLSGEARDTLNATLNDRYEGQAGRFVGWLNQRFGFPNAHATQEAIQNVERTVNRGNYARAYRDGDRAVWSPELERMVGSPAVESAMRSAIASGKDRSVNQGFGGFRVPFTVTPDGRLTFNRGPNGVPTYPNLQFWDYTRRELTDAASAAQRAGRNEEAGRYGALARSLNEELDRLVPSYQNARQGAAGFFGAENALEAGQAFVHQNFAVPQTRAALARMSPQERQLFQQGFVSRYIDTINQVQDRADVVRRIYNTPAAREKIDLALGPQHARELEAMLRVENVMQSGLRGVQGGSNTTQQLTQLGLAGAAGGAIGAGGSGALGYDPTIGGIVGALTAAGKSGVDRRVAERVARLLVSDDPAVVNRAMASIAANPNMMRALRAADSAGAKAVGSQSSIAVPALQSPSVGRAQDDQPTIPRPPSQQ